MSASEPRAATARLAAAPTGYAWVEEWGRRLAWERPRGAWAHPGVAVTSSGLIAVGHPAEPTVVLLDHAGRLAGRIHTDLSEVHGLRAVLDEGEERLWVADTGTKSRLEGGDITTAADPLGGRVVQLDLLGRVVRELAQPGIPAYAHAPWSPTSIDVDPAGDVWVADGYGASLLHRYDPGGTYRDSLTGNEGAGRFDCPHAVLVDGRGDEPELLVADRGNHRIQVFGLDGRFRRAFGDGVLHAPTEMAVTGDLLAVTDLVQARVTLFDGRDRVVAHVAEDAGASSRPGWPNAEDRDGRPAPPPLQRGRLNSPHGIAADAWGNLYVGEWLLGARYVKLAAV